MPHLKLKKRQQYPEKKILYSDLVKSINVRKWINLMSTEMFRKLQIHGHKTVKHVLFLRISEYFAYKCVV